MFKKIFIVLLLSLVPFVYVGCKKQISSPSYEKTYSINSSSKNIVKDKQTNLIWQDNDDAKSIKKDWGNARRYCAHLTLGGYDDWRLPSMEELRSIVDFSLYKPAINISFKNVANDFYWSSTSNAGDSSKAWIVSFAYGYDGWCPKSYAYFVRCVR